MLDIDVCHDDRAEEMFKADLKYLLKEARYTGSHACYSHRVGRRNTNTIQSLIEALQNVMGWKDA